MYINVTLLIFTYSTLIIRIIIYSYHKFQNILKSQYKLQKENINYLLSSYL